MPYLAANVCACCIQVLPFLLQMHGVPRLAPFRDSYIHHVTTPRQENICSRFILPAGRVYPVARQESRCPQALPQEEPDRARRRDATVAVESRETVASRHGVALDAGVLLDYPKKVHTS